MVRRSQHDAAVPEEMKGPAFGTRGMCLSTAV
jgi:hypothetical protein